MRTESPATPEHFARTEPPRIFLNRIVGLGWLIGTEFGRVDDCQDPECWSGVTDHVGYLHDSPGGRVVGFKVLDFPSFFEHSGDCPEVTHGERFHVPSLALASASIFEIAAAVHGTWGWERPSLNRLYFERAAGAEDSETEIEMWLACLETGDSMAHYGLGTALCKAGRHHEAYRHLRYYCGIASADPWANCWRGRAAEALGLREEAAACFREAIRLCEEDPDRDATDAPGLLEDLILRHPDLGHA